MNVKQTVKKMSAVLAGATMLGATVFGAMAYTLSDYPSPFVQNGVFNGKIVVGEEAKAQDIIGASDIAASIQAASKTPATGSSGMTTTVTGGEDYDEQYLNGTWTAVNLTDTKLAGFKDTNARFDGEDIDYEDLLVLGPKAFQFRSSFNDEEFEGGMYLAVPSAKDIEYRVVFAENISALNFSEDDLEFSFLGKTLKITNVADADTFTVESSSEQFMKQGEELEVSDHTVTLVRVGETSVIVNVDGQQKVISDGNSAKFDQANDFEVEVESIFYEQGATDNGANLKLGAELTQTVSAGQSAELFGEPDKESEADWIWTADLDESSSFIGLENNMDRTDLDNDKTNRPALALGEYIDFPNNYVSVGFSAQQYAEYATVTVTVDDQVDVNEDDGASRDNMPAVIFEADSKIFKLGGNDADKVYVIQNLTAVELWYNDGTDDVLYDAAFSGADYFTIEVDDDTLRIDAPANITAVMNSSNFADKAYAFNVTAYDSSTVVDSFYFWVDADVSTSPYFGTSDEEESGELVYEYGGSSYSIGNKDYDYMTNYGVIISDPESQFGSGSSFEFQVPMNRVEATILVKTSATSVDETADDTGAYVVNQLPVGATVLDKDAESLLGSTPLIVVGGPIVNTVAAELMGNPTTEEINAMFSPGLAKIKLYADQNALLVAGFDAQDTLGAAYVLADYADYDLSGTEVEVVVPSLSALSVRAPTLPATPSEE